jgi:hypothetical protein
MIAYANKKGVKTRIHTNATLLSQELDREMIMAGLDLISFSFDGFTKEEYEKNRTGAEFEKSLANIIDFLKVKKDLDSKKPYTIIQVIQSGETLSGDEKPEHERTEQNSAKKKGAEQKRAFMENFRGLPLDKIVIRKPHNWGGLLMIDKINGGIRETGEVVEEAKIGVKIKAGAKTRVEPGVKTEEETGAVAKAETEEKSESKKYACCTFPWYSLTVFYDGRVFLCPQDFEGKICLGDASSEKIEEIFNGAIIRDIRKRFKSGRVEDIVICRNCDRIMRKTFMGVPVEYLGVFLGEQLRD